MANCGWPAIGAPLSPRPPMSVPAVVVEIGVEAGQHHRAVRQSGDGREQRRGRRDRAGRAGGDHRRARCRVEARGSRPRSACRAAPPARSRRARRGSRGQVSRAIFRNPQRQLPIFVEIARAPGRRGASHGTCRVVMSSISRARSSASASAAAGCRRPAAARRAGAAPAVRAHFEDQRGEQHAALQAAERRRQVERACGAIAGRRLRRTRFRPRRCRRSARCAAGSRRRPSTSRKTRARARQARRVGR